MSTLTSKIAAAIDVGSNSIKTLAAGINAAGFFVVHGSNKSITARLQAGLKDGVLDEAGMQRAEDAIADLAAHARRHGAEYVKAFGTSALRDSRNAAELVKRVKDRCDVELEIISGIREAESAFIAAAPAGEALVLNPGGGSTEIIHGFDGRIDRAASAHVGAVSLLAASKGLSADEVIDKALSIIEPQLAQIGDIPKDCPVIASGGAPCCAASVALELPYYDKNIVNGYVFTRENTDKLYRRLFPMPLEEAMKLPGTMPDRADILPYGLAILCAFMRASGIDKVTICNRGNLYGFLRFILEDR